MKKRKIIILTALSLAVALALAAFMTYRKKSTSVEYKTTTVQRGELTQVVTATGSLNAVVTVQVGSQVSGTISAIEVDFNSSVKEGQVIARIEPSTFQAKVEQARANLSSALAAVNNAAANVESVKADIENARSGVQSGQAEVEKSRVAVADARRILKQNEELLDRKIISRNELDKAQINYDSTLAQLKASEARHGSAVAQLNSIQAKLKVAEAQHLSALAQVEQARAALKIAELDLSHTIISSPVDGIVVSRNIDVGQTVAASFQAPTLFLIARDLTRMQVNANVSEADIGRVREGQDATFLVDAFPMSPFRGKVVQVRNSPIIIQNVVTYDVVIAVDNPRLELKPGMTANVSVMVDKKENVLKVPNAALRFEPRTATRDQMATAQSSMSDRDGSSLAASATSEPSVLSGSFSDRLVRQLELSGTQEEKVRAILKEAEQQRQKLGKNPSQQDIMAMRKDSKEKIWTVLQEDQRVRFEAFIRSILKDRDSRSITSIDGRKGRVWLLSKQGKPVLIPVTLGIWDEGFTEVISGQINEGERVIVSESGPSISKAEQSNASRYRIRMW